MERYFQEKKSNLVENLIISVEKRFSFWRMLIYYLIYVDICVAVVRLTRLVD